MYLVPVNVPSHGTDLLGIRDIDTEGGFASSSRSIFSICGTASGATGKAASSESSRGLIEWPIALPSCCRSRPPRRRFGDDAALIRARQGRGHAPHRTHISLRHVPQPGRVDDRHRARATRGVCQRFLLADRGEVEMWTAWNVGVQRPQIWTLLRRHDPAADVGGLVSAVDQGGRSRLHLHAGPIHNPDGSESLWCYTKPTELYGQLGDALGHFPLMHFWGPLANIKSTQWIVESAL